MPVMTKYVGLTNYPLVRRRQHGNPHDWQERSFDKESDARFWEAAMLKLPGYVGGNGRSGEGWRYGYVYTITGQTVQ